MLRNLLKCPEYKSRNCLNRLSFTRNRKLPFEKLIIFILLKSSRSLQNRLNEFFSNFAIYLTAKTVTASAFSQGRMNLNSEAFREMSTVLNKAYYSDAQFYKRYKLHRLLALDGSTLRLPETAEIRAEYGTIKIVNNHMEGIYTAGQCSVLYDVLNERSIHALLAPIKTSENTLALEQVNYCSAGDLVLMDRAYPGYELFGELLKNNVDFVARCKAKSFHEVEEFLKLENCFDRSYVLRPNKGIVKKIAAKGLPDSINIRLLKIKLNTGETEVLITSLLNQQEYPQAEFYELYYKRWGIETFFDRIKNRLDLENFTGKSVLSVAQDFLSTIFIANLESCITEGYNEELSNRSTNPAFEKKVNKSISYNQIKTEVIELLLNEKGATSKVFKKVEQIILSQYQSIKKDKNRPRVFSGRASFNYLKTRKKAVC